MMKNDECYILALRIKRLYSAVLNLRRDIRDLERHPERLMELEEYGRRRIRRGILVRGIDNMRMELRGYEGELEKVCKEFGERSCVIGIPERPKMGSREKNLKKGTRDL